MPSVYLVDTVNNRIYLEFIEGKTAKEMLDTLSPEEALGLANAIGKNFALMHNCDIVHGDLTTSNMIIRPNGELVCLSFHSFMKVFIDFGLSYFSPDAEDKAVDLYVLERAFKSTHPASENLVRSKLTL